MNALDAIFSRRGVGRLVEPAPSDADLNTILRAAAAAPDHGDLRPWRFFVLRGEGMASFGEVLAAAYVRRCADAGVAPMPAKEAKERTKLARAPMVVIVSVVRQDDAKIPWDDIVGAGYAAAENALIAATALGYGSMWRTGDPAWDADVKTALGLAPDDAIAGFLYLGSAPEGGPKPPKDPVIDDLVVEWRRGGRADG